MTPRLRDKRGRWMKAPKPLPLDPSIVRNLGAHRRPEILLMDDYDLAVKIIRDKRDPDDPDAA